MRRTVFLDTSYAIALSVESDHYFPIAANLASSLEAEQAKIVTTRAVILEIGNALAKQRFRLAAIELLSVLEADPSVEIGEISTDLYKDALELFRERTDKSWGIIDCISFVVMSQMNIVDALTADIHFEQAGFNALLRPAGNERS